MKNFFMLLFLSICFLPFFPTSCFERSAGKISSVSFDNIKNGDVISQTTKVKFSVKGMHVVPAGQKVDDKSSGHHHILIDNTKGHIPLNTAVPADEKNLHYGKGQTEATLTLSPGKHKLSLQFADGAHRSYGPSLATSIHVTVK